MLHTEMASSSQIKSRVNREVRRLAQAPFEPWPSTQRRLCWSQLARPLHVCLRCELCACDSTPLRWQSVRIALTAALSTLAGIRTLPEKGLVRGAAPCTRHTHTSTWLRSLRIPSSLPDVRFVAYNKNPNNTVSFTALSRHAPLDTCYPSPPPSHLRSSCSAAMWRRVGRAPLGSACVVWPLQWSPTHPCAAEPTGATACSTPRSCGQACTATALERASLLSTVAACCWAWCPRRSTACCPPCEVRTPLSACACA
jgi:hypothetical protein